MIYIIIFIVFIILIVKTKEHFYNTIPPKDKYRSIEDLDLGETPIQTYNNLIRMVNLCDNNELCMGIKSNSSNRLTGSSEIEKIPDNATHVDQVWKKHPERLKMDVKVKSSIGIQENPNSNFIATIKGDLNLKKPNTNDNVICLEDSEGRACLNTNDIYHINKLPLAYPENQQICLRDSGNNTICVNKNDLSLLSGQKSFKLYSIYPDNPNQRAFLTDSSFTIPRETLALQNYNRSLNYYRSRTVNFFKLTPNGTNFSIRPPGNLEGDSVLENTYT